MKTIKRYMKSILGAILGVQSEQQLAIDTKTDSLIPLVIACLAATAIFATTIVLTVSYLLNNA